jgi:HK97 family phage major capsid protein/HK97 family phage prohead protease
MADKSDNRTRSVSFSSETDKVERWFGTEILDHSPKSIRSEFIKSGRAPLLLNHDTKSQVGVIDKASFDKRQGRGDVRFGRTGAASDALQNVDDGILVNTSVGYRVYEMVLEKQSDDGDTFRITDWEPYEVSLVAVPADSTVGVGRASRDEPVPSNAGAAGSTSQEDTMSDGNAATADSGNQSRDANGGEQQSRASGGEPNATAAGGAAAAAARRGVEMDAIAIENSRIKGIQNLCQINRIEERLQRQWITSGLSIEGVTEELLKIIEHRGKVSPRPVSHLDLTQNETQRFSVCKAILAAHTGDWSKAGFEGECSRAIANKLQTHPDPKKFYVPYDVQQRGISRADIAKRDWAMGARNGMGAMTRADTVGAGNAGGYLVATELVSFIDLLRNRTVAFRMGARSLAGLVGNVTIPKLTGAATAYWLGSETTQITEANQVFSQLALSPKNVGGYTEISRQLLVQSTPDIEGIVNSDLAIITALAVDLGALSGSGTSGQPVGITNTTGIGVATAGDMATIGYQGCLDFQYQVWNANVIPVRGGYATNGNVAELLMTRTKFANTYSPLWDGTMWDADCCGFPGMSSKQIAASTMIFGDWDQLLIAEWGVLELEVNPYANFQAGIIGVRSFMTCDVGLRYPGAFCQNGATIT